MPDKAGRTDRATKAQLEVPAGMQRIYRRFERWRRPHRGRLPIPEGLWASAATVAREQGVFRTAKVLRLEYGKLKRMAESASGSPQPATASTAFLGRGKDSGHPLPPARIRTSGFPAYGSYLE